MSIEPVLSVTVIDTSYSMMKLGYVGITVIDSKAFVSSALPGDTLGVVSFDVNATTDYPFTVVDRKTVVITAAAKAIQELWFEGSATDMGSGILQGRSMLDPAAGQRGMVLLSDGYHNRGTKPLTVLPEDYPIFTCAMGPQSDRALLKKIAEGTPKGLSYYAPYVYQMSEIYNQIRAREPRCKLVANHYKSVAPLDYLLEPAVISAGDQLAQFNVTWTDTRYTYTSSPNPSRTQLSITLVNPSRQVITTAPTVIGDGYVVYNLDNPQPGTWLVQVVYPDASQNLGVTAGVIEYQYAPPHFGTVALTVEPPEKAAAAQSFTVEARLQEGDEPITGQRVTLEVERPVFSLVDALALYKPQLDSVQPDEAAVDRGVPQEIARLSALQQKVGPHIDLLPHRRAPVVCPEVAPGVYRATVPPGAAGSANLRFHVYGRTAHNTEFSRAHLASVLIE